MLSTMLTLNNSRSLSMYLGDHAKTLFEFLIQGLIIMACVLRATVMIAMTNCVIAVIVTVCITSVCSHLLGLISSMGWSLGTTESISVIVGVGYRFDDTAKMSTAYVESGEDDARWANP